MYGAVVGAWEGYGTGVGYGWVGTGRGNTGYFPATQLLEERLTRQRSGPRKPCRGLEWVVGAGSDVPAAGRSFPTPAGPVGSPETLPGNDLRMPPPGQ